MKSKDKSKEAAFSIDEKLKAALVPEAEQPYPIPEKWVWAKMRVLMAKSTRTIDPSKYANELFESYSVPRFPSGKPEIMQGNKIGSSKQMVEPNDVLLCKINPRINRVWVVGEKRDYRQIASTEWIVLRGDSNTNPNYIGFVLQSSYFRDIFAGNVSGVGGSLTRARPKDAAMYPVPIAPLSEQNRIAGKLESLLGKIKESKGFPDEIPEIFQNFRQSVLASACSGKLTEDWRKENPNVESAAELVHKIYSDKLTNETLPKNFLLQDDEGALPRKWIRVRLGSLSQLITKGASPKWQGFNYVDDGTLFITSENVGNGGLLLETRKYVENDFNRVQKRSILQKGDLLTNIVGASIGRSAMFDLDENANINQAVAVIRAYPEIINKYILIALNSPSTIDFMHKEKVDVARANLSLQDVSNFPINLPPTAEQLEIVRRVESIFSKADELEAQYKDAMDLIESLPEIILSKAFRGELVPQDPDDEPTSVLLKRIIESLDREKPIEIQRKSFGLGASNMMNYKEMIA